MSQGKWKNFETKLIHSGEPRPLVERAVTLPIFQSSTFETIPVTDYKDHRYIRLNNTPNHIALGEKLAEIEGGEMGLVTASGMAAISTALLTVVPANGHLLAQDSLYGGTHHFLEENFPQLGRKVTFFSPDNLDDLEKKIVPETRAIYMEAVSNPLLKVPDHRRLVAIARKHRLVTLIDNTFPSPVNFNPISVGYDVVLHSATKYLNGHTDIVAGCVVGSKAIVGEILHWLNYLGGSLDPHACFLLHRGMKTLGVRVRYQNESALQISQALEKSGRVSRVLYPGLSSHPDHQIARELFRGYGGTFSFEAKGTASTVDAAIKRLRIPVYAPSLGGVETLITRPVKTSHSGVSKENLEKLGIRDTLVRVSVGLENPEDILEDFLSVL